MKKVNCRVVWSLKDKEFPYNSDTDFWVRPWVPQVELLSHPNVKCGMNNCGFGGTIEFISYGKPIACFPHFGDQIDTADLICQSNSGIYLPNTKIKVGPLKK